MNRKITKDEEIYSLKTELINKKRELKKLKLKNKELAKQSPVNGVGSSIVDKLKVLCKDINIDPENVFLEYCSAHNGFDVLYDEGIKETYLVNKGFINT